MSWLAILRRSGLWVGKYLLLILAVTSITFFLEALSPGNAAEALLGLDPTKAQIHAVTAELGLNQPIYVQYWRWLLSALRGNLGHSLTTDQAVSAALSTRLPVTLYLVLGGTLVGTIFGVSLGVFSAVSGGRITRKVIDFLSIGGLAIPNFWLGLILVELFAVKLRVLPATGYVGPSTSIVGWAESLILPVVTLGVGAITLIAKQARDQMLEMLNSEYVRAMRANGIAEHSIIFRHALRNAAIPIVTVIGLTFVGLLGGTVFVETVFVLPGLGSALAVASSTHDLPTIQGISLYIILLVIVVNALIDVSYAWLDPRTRART